MKEGLIKDRGMREFLLRAGGNLPKTQDRMAWHSGVNFPELCENYLSVYRSMSPADLRVAGIKPRVEEVGSKPKMSPHNCPT